MKTLVHVGWMPWEVGGWPFREWTRKTKKLASGVTKRFARGLVFKFVKVYAEAP